MEKKMKMGIGIAIGLIVGIVVVLYLVAKGYLTPKGPYFIKVTILPGPVCEYWYYHQLQQEVVRYTGPADPISIMDHLAYDLRDMGRITHDQFWMAVNQLQAQGVL